MVEAFALLGQICPEGAAEIGEWVTRASSHKILNAVAIMLKAEELLYTEHRGKALEVSPQLAVRILEVGSETHEAWLQRFWAGLLISSTSDGSQQSLLDLVELFSQLTSIPNRIFTVVCTKAIKVLTDKGEVTAKPLAFKPEELASTVGARGPQLQRDLTSLVYLNLIEKSASSSSALHASNEISITPTTLGLQLFALCNGHRGPIRDFYFVDAAQPATAG